MKFYRKRSDVRLATLIHVETPGTTYPIHVGTGLLDRVGELCAEAQLGRRTLVVTNEPLAELYGERVVDSLRAAGFEPALAVVPEGEAEKNWARAGLLHDRCVEHGLQRTSFIVALGGGVIGDLAGFIAATYMRGIDFVQVPTSLLAQVDASVGGKVAVNHPRGKNMLGAFHQPVMVVSDIDVLGTLPDRELSAGLAEVVKHGLIRDAELYKFVTEQAAALIDRDPAALERVIVDSCNIKAAVVRADERESGERAVLNFGHTAGHAVEAAAGYGTYTHGEAIAIGMVAEMLLSIELGQVTDADLTQLQKTLQALRLPVRASAAEAEAAADFLMQDKKVREGQLRLALLERIGWAIVTDAFGPERVTEALVKLASITV